MQEFFSLASYIFRSLHAAGYQKLVKCRRIFRTIAAVITVMIGKIIHEVAVLEGYIIESGR